MTRCDLLEVIGTLEYLVPRSEPVKAEHYYQQLQAFRQELHKLEQAHVSAMAAPFHLWVQQLWPRGTPARKSVSDAAGTRHAGE